jgi:2-polyprenyl-6-methoxyphenol hydroxylase-like FAD-dependent oxidoreductase
VIVGARVAGSTLAGLLGRKGLRVLLIDRAKFPSDTLSTHVIYGDSFGVWERMGAWPRIERIGAEPLAGIDWRRYPGTPDIRGMFMPVNGFPYGLCLRRILLDAALAETAADTDGVSLLTKTQVTELLWEDGRVCGVRVRAT